MFALSLLLKKVRFTDSQSVFCHPAKKPQHSLIKRAPYSNQSTDVHKIQLTGFYKIQAFTKSFLRKYFKTVLVLLII